MHYHNNSKTNIHRRSGILSNSESLSCRAQAVLERVSPATICKWRNRSADDLADRSCRPIHSHCAFSPDEQTLILHLRKHSCLSLDALYDAVERTLPHATRSSIYRLLKRHGQTRLPRFPRPKSQPFNDTDRKPGFIHIDSFMLNCMPGVSRSQKHKHHCFVAVDRATRMVFLQVYNSMATSSACDFLKRCRESFPFAITDILTDNGSQYTLKATTPKRHRAGIRQPFEALCDSYGIKHRTTKPYTPRTNGLVERVNGLIQQQTEQIVRYTSVAHRNQALCLWLNNYNLNRRHSRIALGRMTPLEAAKQWHITNPQLFNRLPDKATLQCNSCSQGNET
jgi:transposase InsO family protein